MTTPTRSPGTVEVDRGPWRHLILWSAILALPALGCAPAEKAAIEEPALETIDIADDPDFSPDDDPRAAPRQTELAGVLPSDFPSDLPIHLPASIDGFGPEGRRYRVDFLSPSSLQSVRASLAAKLAAAGWRGEVTVGASTVTKAGRSVEVSLANADVGCRYAYSY